jgi:DnaK suppressor protein
MPLSKEDIKNFHKRLMELKTQMLVMVKGSTELVRSSDESKGYSQHQADEGTDDFDRRINLELSSKEFSILKQIDRAFEKMDEGTYGLDDITGEEIPIKRLEAIPYACMTVQSQEKFEKGLL